MKDSNIKFHEIGRALAEKRTVALHNKINQIINYMSFTKQEDVTSSLIDILLLQQVECFALVESLALDVKQQKEACQVVLASYLNYEDSISEKTKECEEGL